MEWLEAPLVDGQLDGKASVHIPEEEQLDEEERLGTCEPQMVQQDNTSGFE